VLGVTPPNFYAVEVGRMFDVAVPICANALVPDDQRLIDGPTNW
jgi:hypothetical protein